MLITDDFMNWEDYPFQNSPSYSSDGTSTSNDYFDNRSDEDFLQQLSSDLDIPLFLNQEEDEMKVLNSILDQSTDEILKDVSSPAREIRWNFDDIPDSLLVDNTSNCYDKEPISHLLETPPTSPESPKQIVPVTIPKKNQNQNQPKRTLKSDNNVCKIPPNKKPANNCTKSTSKVLIVPSPSRNNVCKVPTYTIQSDVPPKVIFIDNTNAMASTLNSFNSCIPISSFQTSMPVIIKTERDNTSVPINVVPSIDPKVLKKQQRMIKNRESACLSRKKRKDYLSSLEKKVQDLQLENEKLKKENTNLKQQLSKLLPNGSQAKTLTKMVSLCAVLCLMFINVDYIKLPHLSRKLSPSSSPSELPVSIPHVGRNLLWSSADIEESNLENKTSNMCPVYINQTENVRLALELQRWIGKPLNSNNSTTKIDFKNDEILKEKIPKRTKRSKSKIKSVNLYELRENSKQMAKSNRNELQVFSPSPEQIYSEFFEAINRQDDTFYLVSFSPDHMLLPALNHNKTRRPKMSLILPSLLNYDSSQLSVVPLMQIDCEVLDTQIIHVKNGTIPSHLRAYNATSSHSYAPNASVPNNSASGNDNSVMDKNYKPYFMRKSYLKALRDERKTN